MTDQQDGAPDQKTIWNGAGGQGWVDAQDLVDRMFAPLEVVLTDAVAAASATRVLDVGCGTGATTVAIAQRLGPNAACVGVDLSAVMIDAARARAAREGVAATFVCADAQAHAFDAGAMDMVVSRFGVMFFEQPIQAFANLRRAAAPGAPLRCLAWRGPDDNAFMTEAARAAEPFLPGVSDCAPNQPGQFGFADGERVRHILTESGWRDVEVTPADVPCALPASELLHYVSRLGPVGRRLQALDDRMRDEVLDAVRPAFDRYARGEELRFTAACWTIGARAGV